MRITNPKQYISEKASVKRLFNAISQRFYKNLFFHHRVIIPYQPEKIIKNKLYL